MFVPLVDDQIVIYIDADAVVAGGGETVETSRHIDVARREVI